MNDYLRNSKTEAKEITFIDNRNKCVFNGSDIGQEYSIPALQKRLLNTANDNYMLEEKRIEAYKQNGETKSSQALTKVRSKSSDNSSSLQQVQHNRISLEKIPVPLLYKNKKKKRKNL